MSIQESSDIRIQVGVMKARMMRLLAAISFFTVWSGLVIAAPPWLDTMKDNCQKGSTQDCLNVGVAYMAGELNGNKVDKDPAQAKLYINDGLRMGEQRCKQGDYLDCYTIGLMYFEGGIIPTDLSRGLNYFDKSCKGGYKKACDWLDNSGLRQMIK